MTCALKGLHCCEDGLLRAKAEAGWPIGGYCSIHQNENNGSGKK